MKETEQTLFLKSNILHIRTNEGVFVVINPEILHEKTRWLAEKDTTEWGGDVELIHQYKDRGQWHDARIS